MKSERSHLRPWSCLTGSQMVKFRLAEQPRPAANDRIDDPVSGPAVDPVAEPQDVAASQHLRIEVDKAGAQRGGEMPSDFDYLSYAIGPNLQPSLPPDIAARITLRGIELAERAARAVIAWPALLIETLLRGHDRRKQRRTFDQMPDHMLKDIGLSRCDLYDDLGQRHGSRNPRDMGR